MTHYHNLWSPYQAESPATLSQMLWISARGPPVVTVIVDYNFDNDENGVRLLLPLIIILIENYSKLSWQRWDDDDGDDNGGNDGDDDGDNDGDDDGGNDESKRLTWRVSRRSPTVGGKSTLSWLFDVKIWFLAGKQHHSWKGIKSKLQLWGFEDPPAIPIYDKLSQTYASYRTGWLRGPVNNMDNEDNDNEDNENEDNDNEDSDKEDNNNEDNEDNDN